MNFELFNFELFLAWRPFLDPLASYSPWAAIGLMVPLVAGISLVYKALKMPDLEGLVGQTIGLTCYLVSMMALAAAVLYGVLWFV